MSAVITQTSALVQLANASEAAGEVVLQPGTLVDARVLAVRDSLARIVIAGLAIDVLTEVALQPGAVLKLAVSQTPEGNVRLAVVPQDTARGQASAPALPAGSTVAPAAPATVNVNATAQAVPKLVAAPALAPASPEALAVAQAMQTVAPKQASLSPLFANLPVIVASPRVPPQVQNAASQLLATRPPLDGTLTADDLRQAFQKSGLFLEATLARGATPTGAPDLKAALVVFKQVLTNWLGQIAPAGQFSASARPPPPGAPAQTPAPPLAPAATTPSGPTSTNVAGAGAQVVQATSALPGARPQAASVSPEPIVREHPDVSSDAARTAAQLVTREPAPPLRRGAEQPETARLPQQQAGQPQIVRQASDPPPYRGAAPSPQPVAAPTVAPDAAPASMGRQLLEQTDAALARQTLLQIASLPDRPELNGANQSNQQRWSFEIPFATPQGTAVAQFEIARDGGNDAGAAAPSRVWRARFTLDVEPAGPVHAQVSLIGDKTSVRMWAERAATAAQLRENSEALGQALRQAELEPGDILIGEGTPPQPAKRPGRFLDRAT